MRWCPCSSSAVHGLTELIIKRLDMGFIFQAAGRQNTLVLCECWKPREVGSFLTCNGEGAAVGLVEPEEKPQDCGLSAAARAHDRATRPGRHLQ